MCINCGYTYASENGFCSELCQREFTEETEQAEDENLPVLIPATKGGQADE